MQTLICEKGGMPMSLRCRVCGRPISEKIKKCICGYDKEGWGLMELEKIELEKKGVANLKVFTPVKESQADREIVIKEIDSWVATFSVSDGCINLSTPALHPFSLKLAIHDLEELLEFVYQSAGRETTLRKLQLSAGEISDLVGRVQRLIEEKMSKVTLRFDDDELKGIVDLINEKLKNTLISKAS